LRVILRQPDALLARALRGEAGMMTTIRRLSSPVLLLALAFSTPSLHAQDGLKSVDLGAALKTFVQSVKQANATDAASTARQHAAQQQVTNLHARITATNSTAEEQFGAHVQALEISTDAALARLAAVRRTATLLATAREALAGARRGLGMSAASETTALPSPTEERSTDTKLGDFAFAEGEVDRELVEANQAAEILLPGRPAKDQSPSRTQQLRRWFRRRAAIEPVLPQGQRGRQPEPDAGRGRVEPAQVAADGFIVPVPAGPGNAPSARPLTARNPTHSRLERLEFFRDDCLAVRGGAGLIEGLRRQF